MEKPFIDAPRTVPTVVVLLPLDRQWCRQLLRGISEYAHAHGPWRFYCNMVRANHGYRLPRDWDGQGVIAWVGNPRIYADLRHVRAPIVNLASNFAYRFDLPRVVLDNEQVGYLAGRHLLDCGLRHFGYCTSPRPRAPYNGFYHALDEAGLADRLHCCPDANLWPEPLRLWRGHERRLLAWVRSLPKPVGILAMHHLLGQALVQVCLANGFRVPEDVAVINAYDDPTLCEMCHPPLSAVDAGGSRQGYEAAALLDRLMRGEAPPSEPVFVPPVGVTCRQSSDVLAMEDPAVTQAVRFIREHIREPITIADVLRAVPVARRSLERRFRHLLGHTPAEEIRRLRLKRACELLASTALPMPAVAKAAGFANAEYMARVFRQRLGVSPYAYRRRPTALNHSQWFGQHPHRPLPREVP